jgi:hypothetical protein
MLCCFVKVSVNADLQLLSISLMNKQITVQHHDSFTTFRAEVSGNILGKLPFLHGIHSRVSVGERKEFQQ